MYAFRPNQEAYSVGYCQEWFKDDANTSDYKCEVCNYRNCRCLWGGDGAYNRAGFKTCYRMSSFSRVA